MTNRQLNANQIENGSRSAELGPQTLFTVRKEGLYFT